MNKEQRLFILFIIIWLSIFFRPILYELAGVPITALNDRAVEFLQIILAMILGGIINNDRKK